MPSLAIFGRDTKYSGLIRCNMELSNVIYKCCSYLTVNTPQLISINKANCLILLKEITDVNRKNHKKHVKLNKICGQSAQFFNVLADKVNSNCFALKG